MAAFLGAGLFLSRKRSKSQKNLVHTEDKANQQLATIDLKEPEQVWIRKGVASRKKSITDKES